MYKYFFTISLSLCCSITQAQTDEKQSISLEKAIEASIANAYTLKSAQTSVSIAKNNNNYGEAGRYPTITFGINSQNSYQMINNPASFLNGARILGFNATGNLDASWVLFEGFKVRITKDRFNLLQQQSEGNAQVILENLVAQTTKAFTQAQIQRERWRLNADLLRVSREKMTYIETRREYGQAVEFDRLQILDAYLNDSIQWAVQGISYELALQNLVLAMGFAPDALAEPADTLAYELPVYDWESLLQDLLDNNQQLKNLAITERIAQADIELRKTSLYPRITMNAGVSEQVGGNQVSGKEPLIPNDWRGSNTFTGYINFGFNYTIFNGGKLKRAVENAELQEEIATLNTKETKRNLSHQLRILWERYQQQQQIYALTVQLNENAQKNLTIAEEKFKLGTLNYFDFRTIQTNYIRSMNARQDAFLNAKTTEIDMLQLSGRLVKTE